ncbi:hypothetical protein C4D60_Mb04t35400 [Musa balbisiana]|uniref:YTH domain-containing family protein n=1 Tax=Musa balbisiana TaxID=52838 RepID=A0A4S8KH21_MUSBA|nr:hypothetical protein C4D60_Mb04t35400 [Musa balbisiana]
MAAVAPAPLADQTTDLMRKLSLDSKNMSSDASEVTKKPSGVQYGSVNGREAPMMSIPTSERSLTPLLQEHLDASMCYYPNGHASSFYYGGYDGSTTEWEAYPRYVSPDGSEVPPLGVYGDMYHHGYGYAPYGPWLGHNSQLYGPQHYQFPATYYQPPRPTCVSYTTSQTPSSKGEVSTSAAADLPSIPVDMPKADSNVMAQTITKGNDASATLKPNRQNSLLNQGGSFGQGGLLGGLPSGYQDPRFGFDGMWSPVPWFDGPIFSDGQHKPATTNNISSMTTQIGNTMSTRNQNIRLHPHHMGMHASGPADPGVANKLYPSNRMYGQNVNGFGNHQSFSSSMYNSRMNGRWGMSTDNNYKLRGRGNGFCGYGNENLDGLSELNKGPRAGCFRNQKGFGPNVTIAVTVQSLPANVNVQESVAIPGSGQYNKADFPETHSNAKFFIIKSYSEDDIHKSIKYNIWSSTPHGNKKLDAAYQESKEQTSGFPIFLFFSVNMSGQFVGVAEMIGPVNFNRTFGYWQQDKWIGCFPVEWHIVKDVPNNILKHIILEDNENKPVTNSRDTQEVKLDQGLQLLKLFKDHIIEEKPVHFDEKDMDGVSRNPGLQKPLEVKNESGQGGLALGESAQAEKRVALQ